MHPTDAVSYTKVTHRSQGPSINWEYLQKLHPAVPVIQVVSHHVEAQFRTWTRYSHHTDPRDAKGVRRLQDSYVRECIHETRSNRELSETDKVKDFYNDGLLALDGAVMRWAQGRGYERARTENWETLSEDDGDGLISSEERTSDESVSDE